jgi:uncharacterized protein (TIGR03382 family)
LKGEDNPEERKRLKMYKLALLATASALTLATVAKADTVTIGYFDPSPQANMSGIQILGTNTGAFPIVQLTGLPIFPNTPPQSPQTSFGFDHIIAMVIPPGGNQFSGGLGGTFPTFEFAFNDGFAPPQGGVSYLYASWRGTFTGGTAITMPTMWGTTETPAVGTPGFTVTSQVLVCSTPNPFCGPFVGGTFSFGGQDQFTNTLRTDSTTLTALLPGQDFQITELFAFQGGSHPPFAQGDVGAFIMTTLNAPTPVPGPIVGTGPVAAFMALGMAWLARRRRQRCQ